MRTAAPCLAVGVHRAVVVEMIAREVGEQRDVERDAVDAALVEAVRRHFHRDARRAPSRSHCASSSCSTSASGVVFADGSSAPTKPMPSVPMTAARRPQRVERLRDPLAHEVLPLVPVTPTIHSALRRTAVDGGRDRRRAAPSDPRRRRSARATPRPSRSPRAPTAPRRRRARSRRRCTRGRRAPRPG